MLDIGWKTKAMHPRTQPDFIELSPILAPLTAVTADRGVG